MRVRIGLSLILLLCMAAVAGPSWVASSPTVTNDFGNNNTYETDGLPRGTVPPSPRDAFTYTVEWAFGVGQIGSVGVTPVQDTLIWVSSGGVLGGTTDTNWILIFNIRTLTQVDSFKEYVQSASAWGYRDMYYDRTDNAVYAGCESNRMDKINATTHALIATYTLTGSPLPSVVRALTGDGDSLYVAQFASTIIKCSKTGTNCHTVAPAAHAGIYGLACALSEGQVYGTTASYDYSCVRYNFPAWTINDTTLINQITGGTMGGCEMWRNDTFLIVLGQMSLDSVFCLRRRSGTATDVGVDAIRAPTVAVNPGSVITPTARARNFGATAQTSVPVTCWIDSAGAHVYTGTATISNLPGSDTARVTFTPPTWTVGPAGTTYLVRMFTSLAGDVNRANDTTRQTTTAFPVNDTLRAPFKTAAVTLDGNIQTSEWSDALKWDVSDVLNQEGTGAMPPGSAILYCKHDSQYVYYAYDLPLSTARVAYDQAGAYQDENYDRAWATDSSEGNHWFAFVSTDSTLYRAAPAWTWIRWGGVPPNGFEQSSLTSGHLQFECRVDKGTQKWNYNIAPECDTVGFYTYAADVGGTLFRGHWPTTMPGTAWNDPTQYGTLILLGKGAGVVHDVGCTKLIEPTGSYISGTSVTPACSVYNYGTQIEASYTVKMTIATPTPYTASATVTAHVPGTYKYATFTNWTANPVGGPYAVTCSTELTTDANPTNNALWDSVQVLPPSGIAEEPPVPLKFGFTGCVPNPIHDAATITYSLAVPGAVNLRLYDVTGHIARVLAVGFHPAGTSSFIVHRSSLSAGVYLLRLETGGNTMTRKLLVE
jgi:hypothetical protein